MRAALAAALFLAACGGRQVPDGADRVLDGPPKPQLARSYSDGGVTLTLTLADTCQRDTPPTGGESGDGEHTLPSWTEEFPCNERPLGGHVLEAKIEKGAPFALGTTDADGRLALTWDELAPRLDGHTAYVLFQGEPVGLLEPRGR